MDAQQHDRQDGEGVLETGRSGDTQDGSMGVVVSERVTVGGYSALLGWPGIAPSGGSWRGACPGCPAPGGGAWLGGGAWPGAPLFGDAWPGAGARGVTWPRAAVGGGPWAGVPAGGGANSSVGEQATLWPSCADASTGVRGSGS
jgi:hypothetical protein